MPTFLHAQKKFIVVHHSAGSDQATAEAIDRFVRFSRPDLGAGVRIHGAYAKIIERDGSVHDAAREDDPEVVHCPGHNRDGIGVCLIGWFDPWIPLGRREPRSGKNRMIPGHRIDTKHAQYRSLVLTCVTLCERHQIPASRIIAHTDAPGVTKSCPGDVMMELMDDLRAEVATHPLVPKGG